MYNVVVRPKAWELLEKHVRFAKNANKKYANSLYDSFYKSLTLLATNPNQYPLWLPNFQLLLEYRRIIVKKRYSVIYYVQGNDVFVDYIFDARMDNKKYFI